MDVEMSHPLVRFERRGDMVGKSFNSPGHLDLAEILN
jgi:hypothetical protein